MRQGWIASLFTICLGVLMGIGGYTFHYAKGTSYLSNDPKACANCHVMQEHLDSWVKSSHHAAASCNDCHVPHDLMFKYLAKARNGWNHSRAFTLQNFPEPIRITPKNLESLQANCIHCHETLVSGVLDDHHDTETKHSSCTDCHRSVGHLELRS